MVVGLLLGDLILDQLVDVGGHGIDLLDEIFPQFAKAQAGLLVGGGIAAALGLGGQQRQHVVAGVAKVGLQGGRHPAVVLLGAGDDQPGQDGTDLLLGGGQVTGQRGKAFGVVEAIDGGGAQPVGGVDQGGDVVLVTGHADGGVVHVADGAVDVLLADPDHQDHQQTGEQERNEYLQTDREIIQ